MSTVVISKPWGWTYTQIHILTFVQKQFKKTGVQPGLKTAILGLHKYCIAGNVYGSKFGKLMANHHQSFLIFMEYSISIVYL